MRVHRALANHRSRSRGGGLHQSLWAGHSRHRCRWTRRNRVRRPTGRNSILGMREPWYSPNGEGFDEMDEVRGSGSAELHDDGSLKIEFNFRNGDEAVLKAVRI